jgi:cytochrome c
VPSSRLFAAIPASAPAHTAEGPRLSGVYGRVAATAPGFSYSAALTAAQLTWNDTTLNQWLTDPDAFVPGNNMDFRVPRPQGRADLIAFLKQSAK